MERLRPEDPESIGPWNLIGRLGTGGMAKVFLGKKGTKLAAIKIIHSGLAADEQFRNRFQREVEALQKFSSPNVANYVDSEFNEDQCWMATEFVEGPSLKEEIEVNGPLNDEEWKKLAEVMLATLAELDKKGILHRDIKPSNIILSKNGPKLIDFGLAQQSDATSLTTTGLIAGSPAWMSPEVINGEPASIASDLFSLGSVLVFAKSGKSVWGDGPTAVVFHNILKNKPNTESLNTEQKTLVAALLSSNLKQRISKMHEFLVKENVKQNEIPAEVTQEKIREKKFSLNSKKVKIKFIKNKKLIGVTSGAIVLVLLVLQINPFSPKYNMDAGTILKLLNEDREDYSQRLSASCNNLSETLDDSIRVFKEIKNEVTNDWEKALDYNFKPNDFDSAFQKKNKVYESEAKRIISEIERETKKSVSQAGSLQSSIEDAFADVCNLNKSELEFNSVYTEVNAEISYINYPTWDPPSGFNIHPSIQSFAYRWPTVTYYEGPGSFGGWTIDVISLFGCSNGITVKIKSTLGYETIGKSEEGFANQIYRIYVPAASDETETNESDFIYCS